MAKPNIRPYQEGNYQYPTDRSAVIRRDNDTIVIPEITLFDIDYAIYYHLTQNVKVQVEDNGNQIQVPVIFANGEKWSQIRQHGYLRGADKKVLAPIITLRRTDVVKDDRLGMYNSNASNSVYRLHPYRNFGMQYDRTAGQYLKKDSVEYFLVSFPDYVRVSYEVIVWTDLQEQMNPIVQSFITVNDDVWGDVNMFRTNVSGITPDTVNVPGEDRLVKTTLTLQVDGYLRPKFQYQEAKIQKQYSIKTVRFLQEGTEETIFDLNDDYPTRNSPHKEISTQNKDTIKEESANMRKNIRRR